MCFPPISTYFLAFLSLVATPLHFLIIRVLIVRFRLALPRHKILLCLSISDNLQILGAGIVAFIGLGLQLTVTSQSCQVLRQIEEIIATQTHVASSGFIILLGYWTLYCLHPQLKILYYCYSFKGKLLGRFCMGNQHFKWLASIASKSAKLLATGIEQKCTHPIGLYNHNTSVYSCPNIRPGSLVQAVSHKTKGCSSQYVWRTEREGWFNQKTFEIGFCSKRCYHFICCVHAAISLSSCLHLGQSNNRYV